VLFTAKIEEGVLFLRVKFLQRVIYYKDGRTDKTFYTLNLYSVICYKVERRGTILSHIKLLERVIYYMNGRTGKSYYIRIRVTFYPLLTSFKSCKNWFQWLWQNKWFTLCIYIPVLPPTAGLPDFPWCNIPKWGNIHQITTKYN
jgi:hypothetical protein